MKMAALTAFMKDQPKVSKVYLINQNYSHGQQVSKFFKEGLTRNRPDAKIVGDDLHPLGQVKDFAPYVAKIKQSGADTDRHRQLGSGHDPADQGAQRLGPEGADLRLLRRRLGHARRRWPRAASSRSTRSPTTTRTTAARCGSLVDEYKKKFNDDMYTFSIYNAIVLLGEAMAKAKSTDPVKVAARDGRPEASRASTATAEIRKTDHQMQQGLWISKWQKVDAKNKYSVENTGFTFAPVKYLEPYIASTPTSCDMKRPAP